MKQSMDCCVQTDLFPNDLEINEQLYSAKNYSNLLSRSLNVRNKNQLRIDVKINNHTIQLRQIEDKTSYKKNTRRQFAKSFQEDEKQIIVRKKKFIPQSFHIETQNNIATPQQILLPQKQYFTPLHVLKRKLNYPSNPYRLKTCPDEGKFCDRILYSNIIPEKARVFDGMKALK